MYKKFTFNQWLVAIKYFNSVSHFKRYVSNISPSSTQREEVIQYFKSQYQEWFEENLIEVI
ncbi:MAG: hypothetical protein H7Y18_06150 [Clostridiaceae bacterium]|nr:hypothetical protein [Clostridiaceae bacterium]